MGVDAKEIEDAVVMRGYAPVLVWVADAYDDLVSARFKVKRQISFADL